MNRRVRLAATCQATEALGPGIRACAWVQGCPFRCRGCIAPEWIPDRGGFWAGPEELAARLLADPRVTGLTLSGGEPMMQAAGLAATVRAARALRDVDVICFTGFSLDRLRSDPPAPGVAAFMDALNVLIDGQYVRDLNDGVGLRGSSNQVVHQLTGRLGPGAVDFDFVAGPRVAELVITDRTLTLIGIPPSGVLPATRRFVAAHPDREPRGET